MASYLGAGGVVLLLVAAVVFSIPFLIEQFRENPQNKSLVERVFLTPLYYVAFVVALLPLYGSYKAFSVGAQVLQVQNEALSYAAGM
jgi:glucan phosphoethanolaminetransferase (alkaline phosphatase superfamily)